jgi:hypothetical protein
MTSSSRQRIYAGAGPWQNIQISESQWSHGELMNSHPGLGMNAQRALVTGAP